MNFYNKNIRKNTKPAPNLEDLRYFAIYKPYLMLCQFTDEGNKQGLKRLHEFPTDVYPVGRLDADSEGLLLLTNDNYLKHRLLMPVFEHKRTYLAQVEGVVSQDALKQLAKGVTIQVDGQPYNTLPAEATLADEPTYLPARNPPIRQRDNIPTSWIRLVLTEGKNRQIRKMTASVGFPTLRLVRTDVGAHHVGTRHAGEVWEIEKEVAYQQFLNQ